MTGRTSGWSEDGASNAISGEPKHIGCACCPAPQKVLSLVAHLHPGFGCLDLTCDGDRADGWDEFCEWPTRDHYVYGRWYTSTTISNQPYEYYDGGFFPWRLCEELQLVDVEEAVLGVDPRGEHVWRLHRDGPLHSEVYQRQLRVGLDVVGWEWVLVEQGQGFA